jgi:hypothetical protein
MRTKQIFQSMAASQAIILPLNMTSAFFTCFTGPMMKTYVKHENLRHPQIFFFEAAKNYNKANSSTRSTRASNRKYNKGRSYKDRPNPAQGAGNKRCNKNTPPRNINPAANTGPQEAAAKTAPSTRNTPCRRHRTNLSEGDNPRGSITTHTTYKETISI